MESEALKPLFAVNLTLIALEQQRYTYNSLMTAQCIEEARQQLKSMQSQMQSIMTAYNSALDNLNAAVTNLPDHLDPFMEG